MAWESGAAAAMGVKDCVELSRRLLASAVQLCHCERHCDGLHGQAMVWWKVEGPHGNKSMRGVEVQRVRCEAGLLGAGWWQWWKGGDRDQWRNGASWGARW